MDYQEFTPRDKAFAGFVKYRREILDAEEKGDFVNAFTELCTLAMSGDCVAQDCVAYFFNKGVPGQLAPNYEYYMSWQILAGANGNEFALEKMEFFLRTGVDAIVYEDEVIKTAMKRRNLNKDNAIVVIGNLICEGIVDQLKITPNNLIAISNKASTYSPEKYRVFTSALEDCLVAVAEYLMS